MEYDVIIVGAGIAGISTAIRLKQEAKISGKELSVAVFEKGSSIGANIISGCIMDPSGLDELIPNWQDSNLINATAVNKDILYYLTASSEFKLPHLKNWGNSGSYIISLSQLCVNLAEYAENMGVEFYPGFPIADIIVDNNQVIGVKTADVGLDKYLNRKPTYEEGMTILAKQIVLAEGARGSITKKVIREFRLDENKCPQTFGLGIKEIWKIEKYKHQKGLVEHFIGYPLKNNAYGGGFIYHLDDNKIAIGLVTALDYKNPYLSPFGEFQKFKLHPKIKSLLNNGKRIEYGARVVVEGGIQAIPQLEFSGGVLVGDCAGFLNVPRIKGVHNAIKSGILAAQSMFNAIINNKSTVDTYEVSVKQSNIYEELHKARNIRPSFRAGLHLGILYSAIDHYLFKGNAPWTFKWKRKDNEKLKYKNEVMVIDYPKPDNKITFDKASSVHLANVSHDDSQPCHLKLKNQITPINVNLDLFDAPETRYCPAGVYEIILNHHNNEPELHINSQNCVHCKACDVKDPTQNINWVPPEAGSGPQYSEM